MTTHRPPSAASSLAAFGAACSELAGILDAAGVEQPLELARGYVESLQRAGWRWRPYEAPPEKPKHGVAAEQVPDWETWRDRTRAAIEAAQAEFEAREAGTTPPHPTPVERHTA